MITAIVLIKAEPKSIPQCATRLAGIEGVSQVYSVSGEWDLVAIVQVTDYEGVATVVTEHVTAVPGLVEDTDPDCISRVFEEGPGAGVGHRTGVTAAAHHPPVRREWPGSPHEATRFILENLPDGTAVAAMAADPERYGRGDDAPSLVEPALLEGSAFRNIRVTDPDTLRGHK